MGVTSKHRLHKANMQWNTVYLWLQPNNTDVDADYENQQQLSYWKKKNLLQSVALISNRVCACIFFTAVNSC